MSTATLIIRIADDRDIARIKSYQEEALLDNINAAVYRVHLVIAEEDGEFRGYLQYGLYKNDIPYIHKLYVTPDHRGTGYAGIIIEEWEELMRQNGYSRVMLSVSSANSAQNFYRLMGYRDIGSITLPGEPLDMIMLKDLEDAQG